MTDQTSREPLDLTAETVADLDAIDDIGVGRGIKGGLRPDTVLTDDECDCTRDHCYSVCRDNTDHDPC